MASTVTSVTSLSQFHEIIKCGKYVVFDFWATWCGPCKVISPVFEKLSTEQATIEFYKVDIDEQPDIAQEVNIRAVPTFMLFKDGLEIASAKGANPQNLHELLEKGKTV